TLEKVDSHHLAIKLDGKTVAVHTAREKDPITSSSLLHDGKRALVGTSASLYSIDLKSGEVIQRYNGHTGQVMAISIAPNKVHFVTGSTDQTLCVFHLDRPE